MWAISFLRLMERSVKNAADFTDVVTGKKIGDKIVVNYKNRTGEHETIVTVRRKPGILEVVTYEKAGKEITKEQTDLRSKWLSTKVK